MVEFRTEKISERVTRIYGICTERMYLIEGDEKAALIDSGSGIGSLRGVVERLTDKPVIVLLTHGHTDHAMGAAEFDTVYMNHRDDELFPLHGDDAFRWEWIRTSRKYSLVTEEDYIPADNPERFLDLKGGDVFPLGGVTLEVYDCAGHTKGSVVVLIREDRLLLLGDACSNFTYLFDKKSLSVSEYEQNLKRMKEETDGKYDMVLNTHGRGISQIDIIDGVIQVCEDIKIGNVDDVPYEFRGNTGYIAKALARYGVQRADGGSGNVVYRKDQI